MEKPKRSKQTRLLASDAKLFRAVWQTASEAMALFDAEGRLLEVNQAFLDLLGLGREDVVGRDVSLIFAPDFGEVARTRFRERFDRVAAPSADERTIKRIDGEEHVLGVISFVSAESGRRYEEADVRLAEGLARRAALAIENAQNYRQSELARREAEAAQRKLAEQATRQAALLRQLITAQEAERRRLAMDLHDGPLQLLAVALMALDRARTRAERGELEAAERERSFTRTVLADIAQEMRTTLADLSSEMLAERGLGVALSHHAELVSEASGIAIAVANELNERLPLEIEVLLYRLVQEAVANARKYSEAGEISIAVVKTTGDDGAEEPALSLPKGQRTRGRRTETVLHLSVTDNGRGFDVEEGLKKRSEGSGLGLRSMRQRIEAAGGEMTIDSQPGKGTRVEFSLPY
jgi:PAS domain S-box-containing protein